MRYSNGHDANPDPEPATDSLRAQSLEIVDQNGQARIKLYAAADGTPVFSMLGNYGQDRITLSLDDAGNPFFALLGQKGQHQVELSVPRDGAPHLRLFDENQTLRSAFYVDENRPSLNLYDTKETLRAALFLEEDGRASITLYNRHEQKQAGVSTPLQGQAGLIVEDDQGNAKVLL